MGLVVQKSKLKQKARFINYPLTYLATTFSCINTRTQCYLRCPVMLRQPPMLADKTQDLWENPGLLENNLKVRCGGEFWCPVFKKTSQRHI